MIVPDKVAVHEASLAAAHSRLRSIQDAISAAQEGNEYEGKSSAGDKHETAAAMAHLELEKLASQLQQAKALLAALSQIDPKKVCRTIVQGALIETNKGWFYIAAALGKVEVQEQTINVISFASPLVQELNKAEIGKVIRFNNIDWLVKHCY
jgi:hypothetical protein